MANTTNIIKTTGKQTGSLQIFAVPAIFDWIQLFSDGTNAASLIVYDTATSGGAAVGNEIAECYIAAGSKQDAKVGLNYRCTAGCYVVLTGTGAYFIAGCAPLNPQ